MVDHFSLLDIWLLSLTLSLLSPTFLAVPSFVLSVKLGEPGGVGDGWRGHQQAVSATLWLRQDKFIQTTESCGGKGMAEPLSQGESAPTLALTGFYWFNLHRNTGHIWKAHQSWSGSNNQ